MSVTFAACHNAGQSAGQSAGQHVGQHVGQNVGRCVAQYAQAIDLSLLVASPEALAWLSEPTARRLMILPIAVSSQSGELCLIIAAQSATDKSQQDRLLRQLGVPARLKIVIAEPPMLLAAIDKCYRQKQTLSELLDSGCSGEIPDSASGQSKHFHIDLLEALLREACRRRASDIHLSPVVDGLLIRFRVDGVLVEFARLHKRSISGLNVRLKILAELDIAESRLPQDGQFAQIIDGCHTDFRISLFPTVAGENIVLRIIGRQEQAGTLDSLQLSTDVINALRKHLQQPDGMILVCGPTGSGKSTTLFAMLAEKDQETLNIMTLEDPVEQRMPGIRQTAIDPARSFDFAQGLKAMLRQDPDVLLLGEIRDQTSCEMALRAVTSGHQVLTTLHAGSAHAAITRLRELNAQLHILASSLAVIVAQRLIRKNCAACDATDHSCTQCHGTGYFGRQAVLEVLPVDDRIRHLLASGADVKEIEAASSEAGFTTMREEAQQWVDAGVIAPQELDRVLGAHG